MVVYVDDFKLSGPTENLAKGWALLHKTLVIDKETGHGQYLGCGHEAGTVKMPDGSMASSVSYTMESFWDSCVQRYVELAGPNVRMKVVSLRFLLRILEKGLQVHLVSEYPWCAHTFAPKVYIDLDELSRKIKNDVPTGTIPGGHETLSCGGDSAGHTTPQIKGKLAEHAACILKGCLYGSRMPSFDF